MFIKFIKSKRGSSEALGFIAFSLIIIFIMVQFVEIITIGVSNVLVTMAYKKGLDQIQIDGQLTQTTEDSIKGWLSQFGIEKDDVNVNGTTVLSEWGEDVELIVYYRKPYFKYSLLSVVEISKSNEYVEIEVEGSTTSYYFSNN